MERDARILHRRDELGGLRHRRRDRGGRRLRHVQTVSPGDGQHQHFSSHRVCARLDVDRRRDGDRFPSDIDTTDGSTDAYHGVEKLHIDTVDEPLFLAVTGQGIFNINAQWGSMPDAPQPKNTGPVDIVVRADFERAVETVTVNSTPSDTKTLGLESVEIDPLEKAREALEKLKQAIDKINSYRSDYGAVNNRFDSAIGLIGQESVATAATRGQIVDADYAKNTAALTRLEIQQKVSNAMLAQANVNPKFLLTLLGG